MTTRKQTIARVVILATVVSASGILAAGVRGGISFPTAAGSRADPAPCVATVLPDTYYQAIAEMNACTGSAVPIDVGAIDPSHPFRVVLPAQPEPQQPSTP